MKRIGIFGWGVVAPKSPNIEVFERNLSQTTSWLEPHRGFGPSNFLVGRPEFDFSVYKSWLDERFGPRKYSQLDEKMGNMVKYAIGAFIQSLNQNPGVEKLLQDLGTKAHVYVGTGTGDFPLQYDRVVVYYKAQKRWNRFWCREDKNKELAAYQRASADEKQRIRNQLNSPPDPSEMDSKNEIYEDAQESWYAFWIQRSDGLKRYLEELREIEAEGLTGDIDIGKMHLIRRKTGARRKLNAKYGCPIEPWNAVDPTLLWNIPNIPAAQISMIGKITGATFAPVAACSGFGTALKVAMNAIQLGQAKAAVIGTTDPEPHPLSVGTFYGARVLSHDGQVSKPFSGMRGTHISGGACIWIVADADYLMKKGFKPIGLEILSVSLTSDADHIITPSQKGPAEAIHAALDSAGIQADDVATWDMHATATPGDWMEFQNVIEIFPETTRFTARKGTFGHGMSVCGGWELTAQHLGFSKGKLLPINFDENELHDNIRPYHHCLVSDEQEVKKSDIAGKINMGIGGINACVICKRW
ncbi:MAG: beta-ketoacyl synthase [Deltaproteobacteria bacterium]|nr:beta-ketoacyl synthase [Deltaproteobacteria bacterium]